MYIDPQQLAGKTIATVDQDEHQKMLVVRFTDGTCWVLYAEKFDWSARLQQSVINTRTKGVWW